MCDGVGRVQLRIRLDIFASLAEHKDLTFFQSLDFSLVSTTLAKGALLYQCLPQISELRKSQSPPQF